MQFLIRKKQDHLDKICENYNSMKQLRILNTVDLSVNYDKDTTLIKISVLIDNSARADMEIKVPP